MSGDRMIRHRGERSKFEVNRMIPMGTMVENGKKHRQNSHLINHFPTSEGVSEVSERANE